MGSFSFIRAAVIAVVAICVSFGPLSAREGGKVEIERVVTPGGIEAWLVSEPSVPVLAVQIAFRGGARLEPDSKMGLAVMMATLLDEGAGDMTDEAFQAALEEKAIRMSFSADQDAVQGSLFTLAPYADEAFDLFAAAIKHPRFDPGAVERVRSQLLVTLARANSEPNYISRDAWFAHYLEGHPYARPKIGTADTVKAITRADLKAFHKSQIGKDRLVVAVVGPIDAARLSTLLDKAFADLPALGGAPPAAAMSFHPAAQPLLVKRDIPQSVVTFGAPGLMPSDPDFIPAYVMNYVLGGGGFASRLMEEIREKRGLTYGIYTGLSVYDAGGLFLGSFSTDNATFGDAYGVLRAELTRMAEGGVTEDELKDAKTYLTGSFALRFDSNEGIADQLLGYQLNNYDIDYINQRNAQIEAVTIDDVARAAKRLLVDDKFLFVVVGQPKLEPTTN